VLRAVWALGADWRVGVTRGLIFGGRATSVPVTFRTVGLMLLGLTDVPAKDSDFENQVASLDVSWRTAVSGTPLRLHLEYGVDDSGWAFVYVPAVTLGGEVLRPGEDGFHTLGARIVWIAPSTGSYPEWYRHGALAWGWTDRGVLLGHELGGEGWGLSLDAFRSSGSGEYGVRLLVSRRGEENLLAPPGAGWGVESRLEGRTVLWSRSPGALLAGWRLAAGALPHQRYLAGALSAAYRF
ncbi:MAG TPA: capsule assembly Wzi family protein, partial [Longimicrobiales bacterium]|nr:capsule assembly Wzi family protein [Longimicrobiales bacterium]